MTRILALTEPGAVEEAAAIIQAGGLVAFPTETVYGLGADACNPLAVARIFEVKGRPRIDPLIVHVADREEADLYGVVDEARSRQLMAKFWPGPLTLVVPRREVVPPIVTAGLETIALRMPSHAAALRLIRTAKRAVAAPSANLFGRVSPTEASHVAEQLGGQVDLILDGGRCSVGVESTIVSLVGTLPRVLRAGGIPVEEIEAVIGRVEWFAGSTDAPETPGQFARHYATQTPLTILSGSSSSFTLDGRERIGLLSLTPPGDSRGFAAVEVLSQTGDLREAAANLFAALHRLDKLGLDRLIALPVPEQGLGIAIMDRLRRCAAEFR